MVVRIRKWSRFVLHFHTCHDSVACLSYLNCISWCMVSPTFKLPSDHLYLGLIVEIPGDDVAEQNERVKPYQGVIFASARPAKGCLGQARSSQSRSKIGLGCKE